MRYYNSFPFRSTAFRFFSSCFLSLTPPSCLDLSLYSMLPSLPLGSEPDPVLTLVENGIDGLEEGVPGQPGVTHTQSA
jgi:hypothetical protein